MDCSSWSCGKLAHVGDCVDLALGFQTSVLIVSPPEDANCDATRRLCAWSVSTSAIKINGTLTQVPSNVTVALGHSMKEFVFKFMDKAYDEGDVEDDDEGDGEWKPPVPPPHETTTSTSATMMAAKGSILTLIVLELFR
ncbi:hypothetical protein TSMEX_003513 [Taenia solium]